MSHIYTANSWTKKKKTMSHPYKVNKNSPNIYGTTDQQRGNHGRACYKTISPLYIHTTGEARVSPPKYSEDYLINSIKTPSNYTNKDTLIYQNPCQSLYLYNLETTHTNTQISPEILYASKSRRASHTQHKKMQDMIGLQ